MRSVNSYQEIKTEEDEEFERETKEFEREVEREKARILRNLLRYFGGTK